jgi:hypothetical protein
MKRINWHDRQAGDIGLVQLHGLAADLIVDFERQLHPEYQGTFVPSHAFIVNTDDLVIEATLSLWQNSVAALNPASEYDGYEIELWRIERTPEQIDAAFKMFVATYAHDGYGLVDLVGFAIEAVARRAGIKAHNPILWSYVCSQAALLFLRYPSAERWPNEVEIRDCDPLQLKLWCEAHPGLCAQCEAGSYLLCDGAGRCECDLCVPLDLRIRDS